MSGARYGPIPGRSRIGTAPDTSMSTSTKITVSPLSSAYPVILARWLAGFVDESVKRESLSGASMVLFMVRSVTIRPVRVGVAVPTQRRPQDCAIRRRCLPTQPGQAVRLLACRRLRDRLGGDPPYPPQLPQRSLRPPRLPSLRPNLRPPLRPP